jgi:hypothetical protein
VIAGPARRFGSLGDVRFTKADIDRHEPHVRFVPEADITATTQTGHINR